ncbi:SDR family NAD(P)-dependent oxidoreductase [Qipengyuania aurantiaca]|uniref:SDR family NAD(P)-dependent oxidoreductase n=1 Tax=Qipengyuania aurantiaca TaxID=2867233 RepID=A0ABX8ZQR3_9SPHN|nr:SDR family NAD(P)-dependent oxidoreductase [Qipengyuania aurantiaca]QZD89932.1 SDR family NAD(P)-dependent oxidoreductase [Qipengyuania aurantiaca]
MTTFAGKRILVTGGSDGIGRELALQLRDRGAEVTVTGRAAQKLAAMEAEGFRTIEADFANAAGVDAVVAAWGDAPLDILVNNAGMGLEHDYRKGKTSSADIEANIHANLTAPILLSARLHENLKAGRDPMIVNVTSGLAITPSTSAPLYCATKAGLRSYSIAAREQLRESAIHVLEALPPMVDTEMTRGQEAKKMSAPDCAAAIVEAMEKRREEAHIGLVKTLKSLHSISPKLVQKILLRF